MNCFIGFKGRMSVKVPSDLNYEICHNFQPNVIFEPQMDVFILILNQLSVKDIESFCAACHRFSKLSLDQRMPSIDIIRELYALLKDEHSFTRLIYDAGKFSVRKLDYLNPELQLTNSTYLYSSERFDVEVDKITVQNEIVIGKIDIDLPNRSKQALQIAVAKLNRAFLGDHGNLGWQTEIKLCEDIYMKHHSHL